jgi:hypothetical protein
MGKMKNLEIELFENLENCIRFMQRVDPNGTWKDLSEEYQNGQISLYDIAQELELGLRTIKDEHLTKDDTKGHEEIEGLLKYVYAVLD